MSRCPLTAGPPTTGAWCRPGPSIPGQLLWALTYKWATHGHANKPKTWVAARYFGKFKQVQERPLGLRRRHQRRLPGQVLLDPHRPAHPGHRPRVSRRPGPGRVLGHTATAHHTPAGRLHAASAHQAERALPALRGRTALRRAATTVTPGLGTMVAAHHPEGDSRRLPRPSRDRPTGR